MSSCNGFNYKLNDGISPYIASRCTCEDNWISPKFYYGPELNVGYTQAMSSAETAWAKHHHNKKKVKENKVKNGNLTCAFCNTFDTFEGCSHKNHTKETINDILLEKMLDVDELDEFWNTPVHIEPYTAKDHIFNKFCTPAEYWDSIGSKFRLARWVRKITK